MNHAVRAVAEIFIDRPRRAGAVGISVIVEYHHAAGCQAGIDEFAAIENRAFDIDIDMGEPERQAAYLFAGAFGKDALMDEAVRIVGEQALKICQRVVGEDIEKTGLVFGQRIRHAVKRIEYVKRAPHVVAQDRFRYQFRRAAFVAADFEARARDITGRDQPQSMYKRLKSTNVPL